MYIFNTIIDLFRKPFPLGINRLWYYRTLALLSVFVIAFLIIYEPFGIYRLENNKFFMCLGFGAMTFLGGTVYELIIHQIRNIRKAHKPFTFGKWSLNNLGAAFCISLANFIFARLVFFGYFEWSLFPTMLYSTLMIGIIPLTMIGGYVLLRQEKKNQNTSAEINAIEIQPKKTIENHYLFDIPIQQIKYVEALQNYIKIAYINDIGLLKLRTERATLKEIQTKIKGSVIVKCHRSFLVNTNAIISATGNSQGLLLTLSDCDTKIPVSRTWVPSFRKS